MATSAPPFDLDSKDWSQVRDGIKAATAWLAAAAPGDPLIDELVTALVALSSHTKWEVRRSVAQIAGQHRHPAFDPAIAKLRVDDNSQVQQAAEAASVRRRNWGSASAYGKQHEDHINGALDGIESRFGVPGRLAVKRVSEQIADTFSREMYHEVIKRVAPLATSAERVKAQLGNAVVKRDDVLDEVVRLEGRIRDLRAMLDGMRVYTAQPQLSFTTESLVDLVTEAAALVRDAHAHDVPPAAAIEVQPCEAAHLEVSRPRLLQALTNLLHNALESYVDRDTGHPVVVTVSQSDGHVQVQLSDAGCGMSAEALADATSLFVTSKPNGTGFGLPLVVKIIESEHAGRFRLESTAGKGTTAVVLLPKRAAGASA